MSYIGQRPVVGRYIKLDQISSGFNGSNTGFSMTAGSQAVFPGTARNLLLSLGGVIQEPDTDFTISGSTLTFTTPPVANTTFFGVIYGDMQATGTPSDGTVLPASIASSGNFSFPQLTVTSSASLLGGAVFNENGADVDFRIEGDTAVNLFKVDASADKIGIGVANPIEILHANGAIISVASSSTSGTTGAKRALFDLSGNQCRLGHFRGGVASGSGSLGLYTESTERVRIDSSGRVGIGTTSPNAKLYIAEAGSNTGGDINLNADGLVVDNSGGNTGLTFKTPNTASSRIAFGDPEDNNAGQILYSQASNYFAFDTAGSERMRIDSSGRVGINETSPVKTLDMTGEGGGNGEINVKRTSGATCMIQAQASVAVFGSSSNHRVDLKSNGTLALTINTSQNIGVGTSSPTYTNALFGGTQRTFHLTGTTAPQLRIQSNTSGQADLLLQAGNSSAIAYIANAASGGDLFFSTNDGGSQGTRFAIKDDGKIGIGTTSPTTRFHVLDTSKTSTTARDNTIARFLSNASNADCNIQLSNGVDHSAQLGIVGNGAEFYIAQDGTERFRIDSSGNVGIGTTSPGTRLTVSDTGPAIVDVHHSDGGTNDEARIILGALSANPPSNRGAGIAALNNGAGHDLLIKTSPSHSLGPTEKMRITSAGLVGIGTTSPVYKLEVVDASVLLKLNSSNEGNYDVRFVYQNSEANIWSYSSSDLTFGTRFAKKLHLVTNGPSKRVTIDDGGNVGIGTTSPSDFHSSGENLVVGSGSGEEGMTIYSGNSSNGVINFADSTSGSDSYEGRIIYSHSSNHMTFNVGDGAERMRIVDGGRLFVGTNGAININSVTTGHTFNQVDDYKWILGLRCELTNKVGLAIRYAAGGNDHDVIIFVKDSTVKFVVHSTGNVNNANNSYGQTSDVSLKENIVDANSQWNDIKNVKVRNFNFKAETGLPSHTQIGVVAQEIETTSPKLVTENEEGIKEVGYSVLYMKAIKALQEAMTRIETLEAEVAALKAA